MHIVKTTIATALIMTATVLATSCKNTESSDMDKKEVSTATDKSLEGTVEAMASASDQMKRTASGLYYKFEKQNPDGQQVKEGDVIVGEMTVSFENDILFSNTGKPGPITQVTRNWELKVGEGVLMMHVGDMATFALDADTVAKYVNPGQMYPSYQAGKGQKIYYRINLQKVMTMEEVQKEQAELEKKMQKEEPATIKNYIKQNGITAKPTAGGLYIIVKEKGTGAKVTKGKEVTVHYTGRLLDGTVFDSSVERGTPFSFKIGEGQVIQGWDQGLLGQTVGTKLQLIIPSAMAYGSRGAGGTILPYSPLEFDVEIISVK